MPVVFGGFERVRDDSREPGGTASGFERLEHGGTITQERPSME
jgi:hypothetical protein